jgi:hypothetical protein
MVGVAPRPTGDVSSRLEGVLRRVAQARPNVDRNALTFWGACRIRDMILDGDMNAADANAAIAALTEVAQHLGLSLFEIRRTIESAMR